jgi:thiamine-phosphate pyrophosphorylase
MVRLACPAIFLVSPGLSRSEDDEGWRRVVRSSAAAATTGIDVIQIREPWLPDRALARLVREVLQRAEGSATSVVVNDRPDIALACGAAGVHLRSAGMEPSRVRTLLSTDMLVGRSVHSVAAAREAASGGVDYVFFGTIFSSPTKPAGHPVQGTAELRSVCEAVGVPVIAIGGITLENVSDVARAGAAGVAAIGLFAEATGPDGAEMSTVVRRLRRAFV